MHTLVNVHGVLVGVMNGTILSLVRMAADLERCRRSLGTKIPRGAFRRKMYDLPV